MWYLTDLSKIASKDYKYQCESFATKREALQALEDRLGIQEFLFLKGKTLSENLQEYRSEDGKLFFSLNHVEIASTQQRTEVVYIVITVQDLINYLSSLSEEERGSILELQYDDDLQPKSIQLYYDVTDAYSRTQMPRFDHLRQGKIKNLGDSSVCITINLSETDRPSIVRETFRRF